MLQVPKVDHERKRLLLKIARDAETLFRNNERIGRIIKTNTWPKSHLIVYELGPVP